MRATRLGIDAGSISVKIVLLGADGEVLFSTYDSHAGHPAAAAAAALRRAIAAGFTRCDFAAVTGSARDLLAHAARLPAVNEIVAHTVATCRDVPGVRAIIEIGGQDSKFVRLTEGDGRGPVIAEQRMNDVCAAGTGAFLERQAAWLGVPVEEFGALALRSRSPAPIAGRCAVFAKTDVVHLRQAGVPAEDIAAGICASVARNYDAAFWKGRLPERPVAFQGGLAANAGVVAAFRRLLNVASDGLIVPARFKVMGALGAALEAPPATGARALEDLAAALESAATPASRRALPRLHAAPAARHAPPAAPPAPGERLAVGIDVGSTSTCVAVLGSDGRLVTKSYTPNRQGVRDSVLAALESARGSLGDAATEPVVGAVGVTGSGRTLVGHQFGAEVIRDEITALARAAARLAPGVETVFELGGQDAKYLRLRGRRLVEFEMNRVCAAGTGAFLQEQAERFGDRLDWLSDDALRSELPIDLGTRCTVFMESDLVHFQQTGCARPDLAAGLSYAVARNYLEKVVGPRTIGGRVLFLGGVAFNGSVVAAFRQLTGAELVVPEHHEVAAALGVAEIALDRIREGRGAPRAFGALAIGLGGLSTTTFTCKQCENACRIAESRLEGARFLHGGACGRHDAPPSGQPGSDLIEARERLLLGYLDPTVTGERVGIPRAHLFFEQLPLWGTFLQRLGYEPVLSNPTNPPIVREGLRRSVIDNCLASKVAYGHVADLLDRDVRKISTLRSSNPRAAPTTTIGTTAARTSRRCRSPSGTPSRGSSSSPRSSRARWATTTGRGSSARSDEGWEDPRASWMRPSAPPPPHSWTSCRGASDSARRPSAPCRPVGTRWCSSARFYNVCDPALNLRLARLLVERGVTVIPFDCLPLSSEPLPAGSDDMVWAAGQDLLRAAAIVRRDPRLLPVMITSFGCGPDSFILKYLSEQFRDWPFLVVEADEHASGVGFATRIEAFLNGIGDFPSEPCSAPAAFHPFVPNPALRRFDGTVFVPLAFDSFRPIAAAFASIGIRAKLLPAHDEETLRLAKKHTSGTECLPYVMHVGDAVRMLRDSDFQRDRSALYLPGSDLSCRVSAFPTSIRLVLRDLGFPDVPVFAPRLLMDKDEVIRTFGLKFAANAFRGMLAVELLWRLQLERRPFERVPGTVDAAYEAGVATICRGLTEGRFYPALAAALDCFDAVALHEDDGRPRIGFIGDDYTRGNAFANGDFARAIEEAGGAVWTVPIWSSYIEFQMGVKARRTLRRGRVVESLGDVIKAGVGRFDLARVMRLFQGRLRALPDPRFADMQAYCKATGLDPRSDPQVIIALTHLDRLLRTGVDGVANVVGFGCMVHGIVTGRLRTLCRERGDLPVLSLSCDFQERVHQRNRIEAFMYQVRQVRERARRSPAA